MLIKSTQSDQATLYIRRLIIQPYYTVLQNANQSYHNYNKLLTPSREKSASKYVSGKAAF
jgi:hypothetical protein